tara:strand:- start:142 stop:597 length:456 start_codon:yes stop_codon:yes gene_type:complete
MAIPWLALATVGAGIFSGMGAAKGAQASAAATKYGADKKFAADKYGTDAGAWANKLAYNENALQGRENIINAKDFASWGVNVLEPQKQRNQRQAARDSLSLANSAEARDAARFQARLGAAKDAYSANSALRNTFGPTFQDMVNARMLGFRT